MSVIHAFYLKSQISGKHLDGMPGSKVGPGPIIQMYGVTMEGNSVLCHIHGFVPYFYVPAPPGFDHSHCSEFLDGLDKAVLNDMRSNKDNVSHVSAFTFLSGIQKHSIS
mgnify:FL=1